MSASGPDFWQKMLTPKEMALAVRAGQGFVLDGLQEGDEPSEYYAEVLRLLREDKP